MTVNSSNYDNSIIRIAKDLVIDFHNELERANGDDYDDTKTILNKYTTGNEYLFRSVYPFRELVSTDLVCNRFWDPFQKSFSNLQRRPDIFIAGINSLLEHHNGDNNTDSVDNKRNGTIRNDNDKQGQNEGFVWVLSMGNFMGLFDCDWLSIRCTRQITMLRYAEFNKVNTATRKIIQTGLFLDIVGLMQSVGMNPLPPSTGHYFVYPGPKTHDGLHMNHDAITEEGRVTQALVDRMIDDLSNINHKFTCDPKLLQRTWHDDMIWYGPAGIGASYTIPRYQQQHQLPFRSQLTNKKFHGHQCRIAEGNYAAFFGWPLNLTNTPLGGFCGLPGGSEDCPMQVVDVYRRRDDKLAENWVFIDMLWYLKHQGVDALERTTGILNPASLLVPPSKLTVSSNNETDSKTKKISRKRYRREAEDSKDECNSIYFLRR